MTTCWSQARRPQTGWNQKVDDRDSGNMTLLPTNQKRVHELVTHPTTLSPITVFKNPCLKAIGEFGSFEHELPVLLA